MPERFDGRRSTIAGFAAGLAVIGVASANHDREMTGWQLSAWVLGIDAAVAAALALVPSGRRWSRRRRAVGLYFGLASGVVGLTFQMFVWARGCTDGGDDTYGGPNVPCEYPAVLGIPAQIWVPLGLVAVPALIGIASLGRPSGERPGAKAGR